MRLVLGLDEAGYGPNMGPLVIAVSAWAIESDLDVFRGLAPLAPEFQAAPWSPRSHFVPLGDSKKIYQPGKGLSGLSFAIRFFETILDGNSSSKRSCFELEHLALEDIDRVESRPWYDRSYQVSQQPMEDVVFDSACLSARTKLAKLGVRLLDFRLRLLDEAYFNESVSRLGNKSDVLGQMSLNLAWQVLRDSVCLDSFESIEVYCDRQGGRKRYAALLAHTFESSHPQSPVPFIRATKEASDISTYSMDYSGTHVTISFQVEGDSLFPPAACSMVAKWARESLMERLNRYWQSVVGKSLKPTAGYAVDAARFAKDIEPWVTKLSLEKNLWWRQR